MGFNSRTLEGFTTTPVKDIIFQRLVNCWGSRKGVVAKTILECLGIINGTSSQVWEAMRKKKDCEAISREKIKELGQVSIENH